MDSKSTPTLDSCFPVALSKLKFMSGAAADDVLKRYVPWHLTDDKTLLLCEGQLMPLCGVLRKMLAENGLVDVQLLDHSLTPKLRPVTWLAYQTQPHAP